MARPAPRDGRLARRDDPALPGARSVRPTVADMRAWSGLTGLARRHRSASGGGLRVFRDEHGRELFDLPGRAAAAVRLPGPAPLPALLRQRRCSPTPTARRIVPDGDRRARSSRTKGLLVGTVLIDGFVGATWRVGASGERSTLLIDSPSRGSAGRTARRWRRKGSGCSPSSLPRRRIATSGSSPRPGGARFAPARSASRSGSGPTAARPPCRGSRARCRCPRPRLHRRRWRRPSRRRRSRPGSRRPRSRPR